MKYCISSGDYSMTISMTLTDPRNGCFYARLYMGAGVRCPWLGVAPGEATYLPTWEAYRARVEYQWLTASLIGARRRAELDDWCPWLSSTQVAIRFSNRWHHVQSRRMGAPMAGLWLPKSTKHYRMSPNNLKRYRNTGIYQISPNIKKWHRIIKSPSKQLDSGLQATTIGRGTRRWCVTSGAPNHTPFWSSRGIQTQMSHRTERLTDRLTNLL